MWTPLRITGELISFGPCIALSTFTVCPRSSDPFYIVNYYINGWLLLGHTAVVCYKPH